MILKQGALLSVSSTVLLLKLGLISPLEDIIGLTTTACAMHWPTLEQLRLQVVLCEEAGEVMEAETLCTLFPSVEHAISIGDPLQLR